MSKSAVSGTLIVPGVFVALTLWFPSTATACTCVQLTVEEKAIEAEAVFLGEVEFVGSPVLTSNDGSLAVERRVNFRVIEAQKGLTGTQVGLRDVAPCFSSVVVGTQLLVYGQALQERLYISCTSVIDPSSIEAELAELDRLGYEPLALTEGPDSQWPPYATGACGLGSLPFLMMTAAGIACLRGAKDVGSKDVGSAKDVGSERI